LLINAADYFIKGDLKNIFTNEGIQVVGEVFRSWETSTARWKSKVKSQK
jgi:type I restriction enzyme M protein